MVQYDAAKADPSITKPESYLASLNLKGYYRCCVYKWKKTRASEHWTLLCASNPQLAKRSKELPNSIRKMIGHRLKFRFRGCSDDASTTCFLPSHLEEAIAECVVFQLMFRIGLIFYPLQFLFFAHMLCLIFNMFVINLMKPGTTN